MHFAVGSTARLRCRIPLRYINLLVVSLTPLENKKNIVWDLGYYHIQKYRFAESLYSLKMGLVCQLST